ncbi:MAG: hypothetical protein HOJ35_07310 [Bdellovibrionales bacterium]|nr:hypothetical protein [Bdellovibrionales bacterium]
MHTLLISGITSLHLFLNHDFLTIEDWVGLNAWPIIMVSKVVPIIIFNIYINSSQYLSILKNSFLKIPSSVVSRVFFVAFLSLVFVIVLEGDPILNKEIYFSSKYTIASYLGVIVFFVTDFLFINYLFSFKYQNHTPGFFNIIFCALLLSSIIFAFIKITYIYASSLNINLFLFLFLFWTVVLLSNFNLIISLSYIVFFLAPLVTFIGLCPINESKYSYWLLNGNFDFLTELIILIIVLFYFYIFRKKILLD